MTETLDITLKGHKYGTKFIDDKGFKYTLLKGYSQPFLAEGHYDGEVGCAEGFGESVWNKISIPGLKPYVEKKKKTVRMAPAVFKFDKVFCVSGNLYTSKENASNVYDDKKECQWPVKYDVEHFNKTGELVAVVEVEDKKNECPPHKWDNSGERCLNCGCKDWMT